MKLRCLLDSWSKVWCKSDCFRVIKAKDGQLLSPQWGSLFSSVWLLNALVYRQSTPGRLAIPPLPVDNGKLFIHPVAFTLRPENIPQLCFSPRLVTGRMFICLLPSDSIILDAVCNIWSSHHYHSSGNDETCNQTHPGLYDIHTLTALL